MEKLNTILQDAVPAGHDVTGKVLGAAFIVTNKDGTQMTTFGADGRCAEAVIYGNGSLGYLFFFPSISC